MRCIYWQAAKPCTVKHPLVYRIRDWLRGGNPEPKPGRKVIHPGDDYGSWSQGFYPAAYPNKKKPPVMRQHQPGAEAKMQDKYTTKRSKMQ